jgi:chorismate mutase/prephenate dehydratase
MMQSSKFLEEYDWQQISVANTAVSAKKVLDKGDKTKAAIASVKAAQVYGLKVLKEHINYSDVNTTRFIIISRSNICRKDAQKILFSFELPHESGSLYGMLSHIIYNDLNMTKIESRPIPDKKWQYRFFVEIDGRIDDAGVVNALRGINAEALNLKILGNY